MGLRVRGIDELARHKAVQDLLRQLIRLGDRALHALGALRQHKLHTVGFHKLTALNGHRLRHDDDDPVASGCRDGGEADAGIAGGRLDDDRAGLQLTRSLRVVDHFLRNAVLDGTGGVEVFKFGQDSGLEVQLFFDVRQLQQGSLADQLVSGSINVGHIQNLLYIIK